MPLDRVSIVIIDYQSNQLRRCVDSLMDRHDVATDLVVVDNSGNGVSRQALGPELSRIRLIESESNLGFARAVNRALPFAVAPWVALINPDVEVPAGALGALVGFLRSNTRYAAVGPMLHGPGGQAQPYAFGRDPTLFHVGRRALMRRLGLSVENWAGEARDVDWVSGACLVIRREAIAAVGDIDEAFFLYFEDVDWCRRCRTLGWRIAYMPSTNVFHASHTDYRDEMRRKYYRQSMSYFYQKHYGVVAQWILEAVFRIDDALDPRRPSLPTGQDDVPLK